MINPLSLLTSAVSWAASWLPEAIRPASSTPSGIGGQPSSLESLMEDETEKPQGWLSWIVSFFRKSPKQEAPDTSGDADFARKLQEEESPAQLQVDQWQATEFAETLLPTPLPQTPEQVEVEEEEPLQVSVEVFLENSSSEVSIFLKEMFPTSIGRVKEAHDKLNQLVRGCGDPLTDPQVKCDKDARKITFKHQTKEHSLSF